MVVGVFVTIIFVWFAVGGARQAAEDPGFFIYPLPPLGSGAAYGQNLFKWEPQGGSDGGASFSLGTIGAELDRVSSELGQPITYGDRSPYADKVYFSQSAAAETDPAREYLGVEASHSNTDRIFLYNWRIVSSVSGNVVGIPLGTRLPQSANLSIEQPIALAPGERAYIVTGRSPIGLSFLTNKCTGYFEQFQDFTPRLEQACPAPVDELRFAYDTSLARNDACYNYVETLPRCTLQVNAIPAGLPGGCQTFIIDELSYRGCVDNHRSDADFYGHEWRVYLGRDQELWRERREVIKLLDEAGRTVDVFNY